MSDWEEQTIEQLIEEKIILVHKDGNHGSKYPRASEFGLLGVPFLTAKNLDDSGTIDINSAPRLCSTKADKFTFGFLKANDVLLSHNATVGRVALVPDFGESVLIGTSLTHFRLDESRLLPSYLAAYFTGRKFQLELASLMSQTTRNQVPITTQRRLSIVIPPIEDQQRIVDQLKPLDCKIELNRKTNETLEAMAQAIFKSWFIDFEPTRAKIAAIEAGKDPELAAMAAISGKPISELSHLTPEQTQQLKSTAALFPNTLQDSELGEIPEGWEVSKIGKCLKRLRAPKRYSKKQVTTEGKIPVYEQGSSILLGYHNEQAGFAATPENPVIIFGDHTCITFLACHSFDISQNVVPFVCDVANSLWLYYAIQGKQVFQEYRRHWSEFVIKNIICPPSGLMDEYSRQISKMKIAQEYNTDSNNLLSQTRHILLPKLLSGEIELTEG